MEYPSTFMNSRLQPSHLGAGIAQMVVGWTLVLYIGITDAGKVIGLMPNQPNQLLQPCECVLGMSMSYMYNV